MSCELQLVDCNCNDCGYMKRRLDILAEKKQQHRDQVAASIRRLRRLKLEEIQSKMDLGKNAKGLIKERARVSVNKNYGKLSYGDCLKFVKPVSFIPNVCQLETQECFVHRKDLKQ